MIDDHPFLIWLQFITVFASKYQLSCEFSQHSQLPLFIKNRPLEAQNMADASQQRLQMWATDAEIDEELQDVDLSHTIGNYVQNGVYDDGMSISSIILLLFSLIMLLLNNQNPNRKLTVQHLRRCSNRWPSKLPLHRSRML